MNAFKFTSSLALAVVLSFAATGCKHKQPPITRFPTNGGLNGGNTGDNLNGGGTLGNGNNGPVPVGGGEGATFNPDDMAQDRTAFAADTIYFEYDSSAIKGAEQSKLTAIASALQADASAKLLVEGYCDERGTEEYNRSLGERRALAARESLANAGVSADRVATRSYGEDRAADPGHTSAAWAKNRRDEFVLLHPK
jgi:outer membrane protein OmpA-like peptidoglycan-associated protein